MSTVVAIRTTPPDTTEADLGDGETPARGVAGPIAHPGCDRRGDTLPRGLDRTQDIPDAAPVRGWHRRPWRLALVLGALLLALLGAVGVASAGDEALDAGVVKLQVISHEDVKRVGSGIIVALGPELAYILTAAHVVVGSRETGVIFSTRRDAPPVPGSVVHQDHWDTRGLALLTVPAADARAAAAHPLPLSPAPLRDKGTRVRLIGHPRVQGDWVWIEGSYAGRQGELLLIQADLREGSSGGAVLLNGQVVGIVVEALDGMAVVKSVVNIRNYLEGEGLAVGDASAGPSSNALAANVVLLTVKSNVEGDTVSIDGTPRGATRLDLDLPPGPHLVRVEKGGYAPFETQVELRAGEPQTLRAELVRQMPMAGAPFRDCDQCPEMVAIPAGEFMMGSSPSEQEHYDDEGPAHRVRITEPFAIGRHEVTVGEFRAFVDATGYRNAGVKARFFRDVGEARIVTRVGCQFWNGSDWESGSELDWRSPSFKQGNDHPVVCITLDDAHAYLNWLSERTGKFYRLPSEAQWEYAARAGTTTARFWGESAKFACTYANVADQSYRMGFPDGSIHDCNDGFVFTAPVGSFKPNDFGLVDMLGNVWEWTEDCWNPSYQDAPADGSPWRLGNCDMVVMRGGAWINGPRQARAAFRASMGPSIDRQVNVGFRPARTF